LSKVFVVDTNKQPLDPVHPGRARILLNTGKAAIYKKFPFTIILQEEIHDPEVKELRIKIDLGSRVTGIAIINDQSGEVIFAAELSHRGQAIKNKNTGLHIGRVLTRATGSFDMTTRAGRVGNVNSQYCRPIHQRDGYSYQKGGGLSVR